MNYIGHRFAGGGAATAGKVFNGLGAAANIAGSLAGVVANLATPTSTSQIADTSGMQAEIDAINRRDFGNIKSFDALQSAAGDINQITTNYDYNQIRGLDDDQRTAAFFGDMAGGMSAFGSLGSSIGGLFNYGGSLNHQYGLGGGWGTVGALAGAGLGAIVGGARSLAGLKKGDEAAELETARLNEEAQEAKHNLINNLTVQGVNVAKNNRNNALLNMWAFGGPLYSFGNGVKIIGAGGSHEENPNGGVPQGVAADGLQNLVEEGEIVYNDYVFSKRLQVPDKDKKLLGLKEGKDYTYADAALKIQKESEERPNNDISLRTLDAMMTRLQDSQEGVRGKREAAKFKRTIGKMSSDELALLMNQAQLTQNMQMAPMEQMMPMQPMQGMQPEESLYGKCGGRLGHRFALGGLGSLPVMTFETPTLQYTPEFKSSLDLALEADLEARKDRLAEAAGIQKTELPKVGTSLSDYKKAVAKKEARTALDKRMASLDSKGNKDNSSAIADGLGSALRFAPAIGSFIGAMEALSDKPNYTNIDRSERAITSIPEVRATPIGQKMSYTPTDINYLQTIIGNAGLGTRRAAQEYSGGNRAVSMNNLLAANTKTQQALGDAYMQSLQYNDAKLKEALAFNRGTDSENAAREMDAAKTNLDLALKKAGAISTFGQMRDAELAAVQANRSAALTNLFNNIGNIGIDAANRRDAKWLAQSGVYGTLNDQGKAIYGAHGGHLGISKKTNGVGTIKLLGKGK